MKTKKVITKFAHESLFNADFLLVVCDWDVFLESTKNKITKEKFEILEKQVKEHGKDDWCLATQFGMTGGGSVIWANPHAIIGTLVHEVTHAAHWLLKQRSVPLSEDTEEVYAYLQEFLFNELVKK